MKEIAIVLLLGCYSDPVGAQSFNVRVDPFGQGYGETAFSVEVADDGNYVVIASVPFDDGQIFYSAVVTCIVVDSQGQVLSTDRVVDPVHATYPGWSNSSHKRAEGGFVVGGSNFRSDSLDNWIQRPVLYFCDETGVFEQYIELGPDNGSWIGRQAKQATDGGYVICGETTVGGTQSDAFVIKTDALGNEEWTRTYGGSGNDVSVAVDNKVGGGYFLGGEYHTSTGNSDLWVQALNDTGGVVWDKKWGSNFNEPNAHLSTAADGNVLVASCWAYGPNWLIKRYLAKLDATDGSILWQRQYGNTAYNYPVLYVAQEVTPGGDLICASGDRQPGSQYFGVLLRTTTTGDSLWMRSYQYHDSSVNSGSGLFRDVMPTPDGGFVAVGTALAAGPYTQDVWVVKVDSMGCLEPGCNTIMGMETQITNLRDALTVAPNPVASGGTVQLQLSLPQNFAPQGALRITVTDAAGRMVHEQQIGSVTPEDPRSGLSGVSPMSVALPALTAGLYHIHLSDATRWISGAKLVVE